MAICVSRAPFPVFNNHYKMYVYGSGEGKRRNDKGRGVKPAALAIISKRISFSLRADRSTLGSSRFQRTSRRYLRLQL